MNKIINFHDVYNISWFENIILYLKSKYNLIDINTLELFYAGNVKLNNACLITIDDGDKTFTDVIYPVLKKYSIPAVLFVSPEVCLKGTNFWFQEVNGMEEDLLQAVFCEYFDIELHDISDFPLLAVLKNCKIEDIWAIIERFKEKYPTEQNRQNISVKELREIDEEGLVTIGAHTLNHPILANENDKNSFEEIYQSFVGIEQILNHEIKYFAYPNGVPGLDFNEREIKYLNNIDCKLAFSTELKNFSRKDNPLAIPRYGLSHGNTSFVKIKMFMGRYWEMLRRIKEKSEKDIRREINRNLTFNISG